MNVMNPAARGDYHLHSSTYSDGLNSIDEIVRCAGEMGLEEIAITDHSEYYMREYGITGKTHYNLVSSGRWRNVHNNVRVIFGVEADLLNEGGDINAQIQGASPDFVVLSSHGRGYKGNWSAIKTGYLKAIQRFGPRLTLLGHLCSRELAEYLTPEDIVEIVRAANEAGIALELNCANWINGKTYEPHLRAMLSHCDRLYVNSDSHTLYELLHAREAGLKYLREQGH